MRGNERRGVCSECSENVGDGENERSRGGGSRRRYFHGDLDLGLDGPQTLGETCHRQSEPSRDRGRSKVSSAKGASEID